MADRIAHLEGELQKLKRIVTERNLVVKEVKEIKGKIDKLEKKVK